MRTIRFAALLSALACGPVVAGAQIKTLAKTTGRERGVKLPTTRKPTAKSKKKSALRLKIAEVKKQRAAGKKTPAFVTVLDTMYFGPRYYSSTGPRYFIAQLHVANLSGKPLTLKPEHITLRAKGRTFKMTANGASTVSSSFYIGNKRYSSSDINPAKSLAIKPEATGATWVVFEKLSSAKEIPPLELRVALGQKPVVIDINAEARKELKLKVERIGPRKSLGLLSISGLLNTINLGDVIAEIDKLTKAKPGVGRFVIRWMKDAPQFNSRMNSWLQQRAQYIGLPGRHYFSSYPFPDLPGSIRELHLARVPGSGGSTYYGHSYYSGGTPPKRIHKTAVAAVAAALKSAYEVLPRDEIIKEIESGHPLTRAAALAAGGGRLGADKLPMIVKFANGNEESFARAAIQALRHFGEESAIDTLVDHAKNKSSKMNKPAIVSLSASRFPAAHRALLKILAAAPLDAKKNIVKVLAANPRPIWSDPIYAFATKPDSDIAADALKALGVIGHPKLTRVLTDALKSNKSAVQTEALRQLVAKANAETDRIALEFALKKLKASKSSTIDSPTRTLLQRTKDPRAIPLLLAKLDQKGSGKSTVIDALGKLGDQNVGLELMKRFPNVKSSYDKGRMMQAIVRLKTPGFMKLAGESLMTKNSSLIRAACEGLKNVASREAVKMLVDALDKSTYSSAWSYTSSALSQIGTKESRVALEKIRNRLAGSKKSEDKQKLNYVVNAIKSLMQRSPAYQYLYQAWQMLRQKQYKSALEYVNLAIKIDPDHPWPLSTRGHIHLRQKKYKEAKADLEKAYKLDPHDVWAITGVALLKSRDGKMDDAIELIKQHSSEYASDRVFPYHAARVYARAIAAMKKAKPKPTAADKKTIAGYEKEAMKHLKTAMSRGRYYSDGFKQAHAAAETDFAPLHHLKEYKTLIGDGKKKKNAGIKAKAADFAVPR